jgi:hypothetical protein
MASWICRYLGIHKAPGTVPAPQVRLALPRGPKSHSFQLPDDRELVMRESTEITAGQLKQRHHASEAYKRQLERMRRRYAEDPKYREQHLSYVREHNRRRHSEDPTYRERELEYKRQRYANDPEYRERMREYSRRRYQAKKAARAG